MTGTTAGCSKLVWIRLREKMISKICWRVRLLPLGPSRTSNLSDQIVRLSLLIGLQSSGGVAAVMSELSVAREEFRS
jgi:hypothetical protein